MKHLLLLVSVFCVFLLPCAAHSDEPLTQPEKAIILPEGMLHPDGMTVHPVTGDIILAVPVIGAKGNAHLLKIDANDKVEKYFELAAHPETGRVTPLGISFGPDGHLYIADSQCLGGNPNHKSRVLRVLHNNGKPFQEETIVTGIVQANGLEIHNGKVYVAETQVDPLITELPMTSGVFRFSLDEFRPVTAPRRGGFRRQPVVSSEPLFVDSYQSDPHFVFRFKTGENDPNAQKVGANGIGLAKDGTLYVANFGDKKIIEVKWNKDGTAAAPKNLNEQSPFGSVDGLKVSPTGYIFFADFVGNAVWAMNPKNGKSVLIAQNALNPDAETKKAGALDRCSEVCLRGTKLYVSNIDLETPEAPNTISVIELEGLNLDELLK